MASFGIRALLDRDIHLAAKRITLEFSIYITASIRQRCLQRCLLMPLKYLVHCVLQEVTKLDSGVGGPIEMLVLTEHGEVPFSDSDHGRYEKKRQQIRPTVKSLLRN